MATFALGLSVFPDAECVAQSRSEQIAISGQSAPGGNGAMGLLFSPQINNQGQVAFSSQFMSGTAGGSSDDNGIFRGGPGGLVQVDRTGISSIGMGTPLINDLGHIAYNIVTGITGIPPGLDALGGIRKWDGGSPITLASELAGAGNEVFGVAGINGLDQVAFRQQTGFTNRIHRSTSAGSTVIVEQGQAAPDGNGTFSSFEMNSSRKAINDLGQVAFLANMSSSASTNQGIFRGNGAVVNQIARAGEIAPDGNGVFSEFLFLGQSQPALNDLGQVAFDASLSGTTGGLVDSRGIFMGDGIALSQIVRTGDSSPDGIGSFLNVVSPSLNNSGQVAFLGVMAENDAGIFRGSTGDIIKIARSGDSAFGGNGFFSAGFDTSFSMNDAGQVAFRASTSSALGGTPDAGGIFTSDGIDAFTVVRTGDLVSGSSVVDLGSSSDSAVSLNRHGQIAYRATLADGRDVIRVWTPELHWRNGAGGDWDSGANWTLGLNPAEVHDVFIDSDSNVVVTGPSNDANVRNLTVGGGAGVSTLVLDGSELAIAAGSGSSADILSNGVLAGTGQISGLTRVSGLLSPGSPLDTTAHLSFQGELRLDSDANTSIELGGLDPSNYDSLSVLGDTILGGNLSVSLVNGFSLSASGTFLIGDLSGIVTGQFIGLGEGDLVGSFGGRDLFITYSGGSGNDIALFTAVPEPSGLSTVLLATGLYRLGYRRRRYI